MRNLYEMDCSVGEGPSLVADIVSVYSPSGRSLYASERRSRDVASCSRSAHETCVVRASNTDFQFWWRSKEATASPASLVYAVRSVCTPRSVPVRGSRTWDAPEASALESTYP